MGVKVDGAAPRGLWPPAGGGLCSLRSGGDSACGAEGDGGALSGADYKNAAPIPVISTEAGQPPIGKPLIVQARGLLRLTWRLYAESPQSGEISFLQWYMKHWGWRSLDSEHHRSGSCLSPIAARSPARDDSGSGHPYRHVKKGARLRRGLCNRVMFASLRGRRPFGPRVVDCR